MLGLRAPSHSLGVLRPWVLSGLRSQRAFTWGVVPAVLGALEPLSLVALEPLSLVARKERRASGLGVATTRPPVRPPSSSVRMGEVLGELVLMIPGFADLSQEHRGKGLFNSFVTRSDTHTCAHSHTHRHARPTFAQHHGTTNRTLHTHTRTHTHTHRHIDTPTHRHTDTPTHRHTDTPTHRSIKNIKS